jgi:hypothetical protein
VCVRANALQPPPSYSLPATVHIRECFTEGSLKAAAGSTPPLRPPPSLSQIPPSPLCTITLRAQARRRVADSSDVALTTLSVLRFSQCRWKTLLPSWSSLYSELLGGAPCVRVCAPFQYMLFLSSLCFTPLSFFPLASALIAIFMCARMNAYYVEAHCESLSYGRDERGFLISIFEFC